MTHQALGTDRLMQVGIVVADVEATARAWSQVLGLPMPEIRITDVFDDALTEYEGAPTFAQARMAFLQLGQVELELLEPVGEPSTWNDQLQRHGPSLHHVAFEVDGMADRRAYLGGQGMSLVQRGEFVGGRYAYFDSQARLGAILELLERDPAAEAAGGADR
jgi:catechol 2,3-dioxygenase-like lactoylglutathione lyase family enzyme